MNKVDIYIKRKMLEYPVQYSSRWNALFSMFFLLGAGYYWDDQGCLANGYDEPSQEPAAMYFSDLDGHEDMVQKRLQTDSRPGSFFHAELVKVRLERMIRQYRADHIDVFVQNHMDDENDGGVDEFSICTAISTSLPINQIPYDRVDKEWAMAADEAANIVRLRLRNHFDLKGERLEDHLNGLPEDYRELYRTVVTVQQELEPITHRAAGTKQLSALLKDIMARTK
jgi:hypothetical protein